MKFLIASGFYPEIGISVLIDKSLIVISNNNKITMHDLLQDLGSDIVSQESNDIGNRSRLWHHEDIYEVLTYNMSLPSNISAEKLVFLEMPNSSIEQLWDGMKNQITYFWDAIFSVRRISMIFGNIISFNCYEED
ncbi:hypothetical protein WN944_015524 [Citrus x changshan-huyou]|uniref:Disease resistance protein Roq1-like winged-helix domain-containing protein n=1 Tax=Citrus x changshan-huyou TaxID=2935761 RepID=A0AAP0M980_9ROSI